ncbi:MAG: DUF4332 domain-containing protein [Chloroflexota bacterium]
MSDLRVSELRGITPDQVKKLGDQGVSNCGQLLEKAGAAAGRKALASAAGIGDKDLLELVNRADLARINGIGRQYSNLLEDAGVDSVPELAQRNAANLTAALGKAAEASGVSRPPTQSQVEGWIGQAKALPRAVSH